MGKKRVIRDVRPAIARVLAGLRAEKNLTQREASARLGKSHAWLSLLERNQYKVGLQDLVEICDVYGADVEEVVGRILRWKP